MRENSKSKKEERLEYGRQYYWKNRDVIRQKYRQQADVANESRKLRRGDLVMYTEWLEKVEKRLKEQDLEGWLRWSLELTRDEIIKKIEELNGRKEIGIKSG